MGPVKKRGGTYPKKGVPAHTWRVRGTLYSWNGKTESTVSFRVEGQGDLVSRLRIGIIRVTIYVIGAIKSPPEPPSTYTHTNTYIYIYMQIHTDLPLAEQLLSISLLLS